MADKIVKKVKKVAKKVAAKGAEIKADIQNVKTLPTLKRSIQASWNCL